MTSSSILCTLLLLLMEHSDIEEKIIKEIRSSLGTNRLTKMEDRESMPYTEVALLEALRYTVYQMFQFHSLVALRMLLAFYNTK